MGRPRGSKNYDYTGSHSTGMKAARSANAYEGAGIIARIKKERREPDYGGESRVGYSVYVEHQKSPRKSRSKQRNPDGTSRGGGSRFGPW
jgi:hypothetical protein